MTHLFNGIYTNKTVLVTGHSGFKGAWLSLWLNALGAKVHGYALAPTVPSFYEILPKSVFCSEQFADIRVLGAVFNAIEDLKPDIVFHLAGQAIVGEAFEVPYSTFEINTMGTVTVLEALRRAGRADCPLVCVTSDKVYNANQQSCVESDPFGYSHPYQASKTGAELAVEAYRHCYNMRVATARAGNVLGGGDYARGRIVPDCVRAFMNQTDVDLRHPHFVRPWQYVLDCLSGYLSLGWKLMEDRKFASAWNFGPNPGPDKTVFDVAMAMQTLWPQRYGMSLLPLEKKEVGPEDKSLTICSLKAQAELGWKPVADFESMMAETALWYANRHMTALPMEGHSVLRIEAYVDAARERLCAWTQK